MRRMNGYYWSDETWGPDYPPENWEEICRVANNKIDEYIVEYGLYPYKDLDYEQICYFSEVLAENWITQGLLPEELEVK